MALAVEGDVENGKPLPGYEDESTKFLTIYDKYPNLSGFECLTKLHHIATPARPYNSNAPLRMLFHFTGTGLHMVLCRPLFWVFLIFHIIITVTYGQDHKIFNADGSPKFGNWPKIGLVTIAVPGSVIAFMFVFYLNQAYAIYVDKWSQVINGCGALYDFVLLLHVHLADHVSPKAKIARHNLCKIINAIHVLSYANLPRNRERGINEWGWWFVKKYKLLTTAQVEELQSLVGVGDGNLLHRHAISWLQRSIWSLQDLNWFVPHVATLFSQKLFDFRTRLDQIYTHFSSPVPFAYYHLLNLVANIYLFILAYVTAFITAYWSIPGYFLILLIFLGIREIGDAMSQPLGSDPLDIPVFYEADVMLRQSLTAINRNSSYPDEVIGIIPEFKWDKSSEIPSNEGLFLSL